ncbi:MAG: 30S ribosome-binding factor RbfA [Chromatiales bacterium]|jgi:ribosome-binding factor A|nr:30S ribosome-binding factor RbfA [Chromatiales bacterium]
MAREFTRAQRVGEQIQRELALLIQKEIKDPRLGMITVSAVKLSSDLTHAKVYVTVFGNDANAATESLKILERAAPFLRHALGRQLVLRVMPHLHFVHDVAMEEGSRLHSLIEASVALDKKKSGKDS